MKKNSIVPNAVKKPEVAGGKKTLAVKTLAVKKPAVKKPEVAGGKKTLVTLDVDKAKIYLLFQSEDELHEVIKEVEDGKVRKVLLDGILAVIKNKNWWKSADIELVFDSGEIELYFDKVDNCAALKDVQSPNYAMVTK